MPTVLDVLNESLQPHQPLNPMQIARQLWFPKTPFNWIRAVREYQHIIRNDGCDCSFAGFLGFPLDRP